MRFFIALFEFVVIITVVVVENAFFVVSCGKTETLDTCDPMVNCPGGKTCPQWTCDQNAMPGVCVNIRNGIQNGKPKCLTYDRSGTSTRRYRACGSPAAHKALGPVPHGMIKPQCDEYPFASTVEGGLGATIRWVNGKENSAQGGSLGGFYRRNGIKTGDCFAVHA